MAAVAVRVEIPQRPVIGREGLLVLLDEGEEKQLHLSALHGTLTIRMLPVTGQDILLFLAIVIAVMLVVVLYHLLFIVVDVRKIVRRFEDITSQVEATILKPISMADEIFKWVIEKIERKKARKKSKAGEKE